MESKPGGQIVTVFRSRLRHDAEARGYDALAEAMERRARELPGFVDFKGFSAADGERVSIVVFESIDAHLAWRDDPEHLEAQSRGRSDFYLEYDITVGYVTYKNRFNIDIADIDIGSDATSGSDVGSATKDARDCE
jgi:heme-degrading monooxygenase HmoA